MLGVNPQIRIGRHATPEPATQRPPDSRRLPRHLVKPLAGEEDVVDGGYVEAHEDLFE